MRTKLVVLFVGITFVAGCQDKKTDAPSGTPSPSPVVLIPNTTPGGGGAAGPGSTDAKVSGQIKGKPFTPDTITLQGKSLTFRSGKDFFPDQEISFSLPEDGG